LQPAETPPPQDHTAAEREQAAIVIQGRIRGAQSRRRAAAKRLVMTRAAGGTTLNHLDIDIDTWLTAHDEPDLVEEARSELGVETLRDLLAVIQDPADVTMFIPEDDGARGDALWAAIQEEVTAGVAALKAAPPPPASRFATPRRSPRTTKTEFGLIHISGFGGLSTGQEQRLQSLFEPRFGTVQKVVQKRLSGPAFYIVFHCLKPFLSVFWGN